MFDSSWSLVDRFTDPGLPSGYAPFGIQAIAGNIFVTFAKQDADAEDEVAGQGRGFVDEFDTAGNLIARIAQHGQLNAPWGLALAPSDFGRFSGDLLVGNFGDGQINAYEPARTAGGRTAGSSGQAVRRSRSTASGHSSSATAPMQAPRTRCSSQRGPTTRRTASSARSRRASRADFEGGGPCGPSLSLQTRVLPACVATLNLPRGC